MPKVPVTSKRPRIALSAEPLIPDSVRTAIQGRRRSSRLAAEQTTSIESQPEQVTGVDKGRSPALKEGFGEGEAAQPVESPAPKRRRKAIAATAAVGEPKPKSGVRQRKKNVKVEADESAAGYPATETSPDKPKKRRRGPSGYALGGRKDDDSAAARRARMKSAMKSGEHPAETVPKALEDDLQRMCRELGNDRLAETAPWQHEGGRVGGSRMWVGCHVSTAGGMERAVINAAATGCRAFAMDTRSKLRWESPPLSDATVDAFKLACQKFGFQPHQILPHGSYLINLASPDPEMAEKGYNGFLTELQRCQRLGLTLYNFHPGSTTGLCSHEESMARIAGYINKALAATEGVTVVLENMASTKHIVGGFPWHLKYIIDRVEDKSRVGFCIDTCHAFSSGLDLRTEEACEATFKEIDEIVGLQYLKGLHINDSKTPFRSNRDRHENIGRGSIPMAAFRWIMNNPAFEGLPLIMETPVEEREPPVDYKRSLEAGKVVWKDPEGPYGVGTDRRDVILLNSLVEDSS